MMGSSQNKSSLGTESHRVDDETLLNRQVFTFKPFKLDSDTHISNRKCYCQQENCHLKVDIQLPKPRSGHRIVCDESNMYSFGGYNPTLSDADQADLASSNGLGLFWSESIPLFKELWKFNLSTRTWKRMHVEEIPDILASNTAVLSGNVLMVFGGTGVPFGSNCSKDLYICYLKSGSDKFKFDVITTTGNCPLPQYGQAVVLIGYHLYTLGGTTGFEYTCDVHRLDLKTGQWEAVYTCKGTDSEPSGRYRHEVAFDGDRIFVLGGGTSTASFGFQTIFGFNISSKTWEKVTTRPDNQAREAFPTHRRCHSCVQLGNIVYIIGGFTGHLMLRDIWKLDLNSLAWTKMKKFVLNRGTYFHSSSVTPSGKLVTFGGIVQTENSSRRSAEVYTSWLLIPKLKEICWEAVMYYFPMLKFYSEEKLLSFGLPYEFIKRISPSSTVCCTEPESENSCDEPNNRSQC